jgi:hypothetical protein
VRNRSGVWTGGAPDRAVALVTNADWLAFWDSPHSIYVCSGEALHADIVAAAAGELLLCEAAPGVRAGLQQRFADNPKIRVIAPHEIARLPEHSLDLIVLHSVLQYLTQPARARCWCFFAGSLNPVACSSSAMLFRPRPARQPMQWRCFASARTTASFLRLCGDFCKHCCLITGVCARA